MAEGKVKMECKEEARGSQESDVRFSVLEKLKELGDIIVQHGRIIKMLGEECFAKSEKDPHPHTKLSQLSQETFQSCNYMS